MFQRLTEWNVCTCRAINVWETLGHETGSFGSVNVCPANRYAYCFVRQGIPHSKPVNRFQNKVGSGNWHYNLRHLFQFPASNAALYETVCEVVNKAVQ